MPKKIESERIIVKGQNESWLEDEEPTATFFRMEAEEGRIIPLVKVSGPHRPLILSKSKVRSLLAVSEFLSDWLK